MGCVRKAELEVEYREKGFGVNFFEGVGFGG